MTGIIVNAGKQLPGEDEDLLKKLRLGMIVGGHRCQHRASTQRCGAKLRRSLWGFSFCFLLLFMALMCWLVIPRHLAA
jgi:hypothetical protein